MQVLEGVRDGLQEMGFAFEITSVAVCSEHLECAEQHKMRQRLSPFSFLQSPISNLHFSRLVQIGIDELFTQALGNIRLGLP